MSEREVESARQQTLSKLQRQKTLGYCETFKESFDLTEQLDSQKNYMMVQFPHTLHPVPPITNILH